MTPRAALLSLAALGSACATVGFQVKDACPEVRDLVCSGLP